MTEVIVDAVLAFSLKKGDLCLRDCSADGRVFQYVSRVTLLAAEITRATHRSCFHNPVRRTTSIRLPYHSPRSLGLLVAPRRLRRPAVNGTHVERGGNIPFVV